MSDFRVGQKVVCIDDGGPESALVGLLIGSKMPEIGSVYTISNAYFAYNGEAMIELVELPTTWDEEKYLPGYIAGFFRPVVERKTDITVFRAMLTPKKESVPA